MEKPKKLRGPEVTLPPALRDRLDRVREARRVGSELPLLTAVIRAAVEAGLPYLETGSIGDADATPPPRAA